MVGARRAVMQNEAWDHVETVEVEGQRIAYRRAGDGPPLVLLHGNPLDSREWRRQFDGLSDAFTVVAWDMPGCGKSSDPPDSFRIPDYVHCLASFIQALGPDRPHVLGLSFGSGLALELYRCYPDIPRSLILASAYAGWAGSLSPEAVEQRKQGMLRLISSSPVQLADSLARPCSQHLRHERSSRKCARSCWSFIQPVSGPFSMLGLLSTTFVTCFPLSMYQHCCCTETRTYDLR
jgi:pimeloyl-ACP methyl ester carboxylesterase